MVTVAGIQSVLIKSANSVFNLVSLATIKLAVWMTYHVMTEFVDTNCAIPTVNFVQNQKTVALQVQLFARLGNVNGVPMRHKFVIRAMIAVEKRYFIAPIRNAQSALILDQLVQILLIVVTNTATKNAAIPTVNFVQNQKTVALQVQLFARLGNVNGAK